MIGGYTDPEGSRTGIGALLVGVREGIGRLFAGKVGTGFTRQVLRDLRRRLAALRAAARVAVRRRRRRAVGRRAHWVQPDLVGEVAFTEWTDDGRLRHPSFQGLRADKKPADVVRERPRPYRIDGGRDVHERPSPAREGPAPWRVAGKARPSHSPSCAPQRRPKRAQGGEERWPG